MECPIIKGIQAQSHVGAHEWAIKHLKILIQSLNDPICCHVGNKDYSDPLKNERERERSDTWKEFKGN